MKAGYLTTAVLYLNSSDGFWEKKTCACLADMVNSCKILHCIHTFYFRRFPGIPFNG